MITQCPKCKRKQLTPEVYVNQQVKCVDCKTEYAAIEYREPEIKSKSAYLERFTAAGDSIFSAIGRAIAGLFMVVICLSIIIVGLSIAGNGGTLGGIQYLLAVIAFCMVILVQKK